MPPISSFLNSARTSPPATSSACWSTAGDSVKKDQPVLELETDKATIEVPSTVSGTVKEVRVKQGEKVKVGQVVLTLDDGAAPAQATARRDRARPARQPKAQPAGAAEEGGLSQAEAGRRDGRARAAPAEPAPERKAKRGEVVDISAARAPPRRRSAASRTPRREPQGPAAPAAPSVRRLARELGVDIRRVAGQRPGRPHQRRRRAGVRAERVGRRRAPGQRAARRCPTSRKWGEVERKPMSNIRRKTAEHLSHAWNVIPHVTQHDKADITALEALRKQYGPQAEKAGGKLTMTAIALKIVAARAAQVPAVQLVDRRRAQRDRLQEVDSRRRRRRHRARPARAGDPRRRPQGHHRAGRRAGAASEKARAGKLSLDDMQGGGFTITNLGGIGGTSFTPIVNWPEVAILGISRGAHEPVYVNGPRSSRG